MSLPAIKLKPQRPERFQHPWVFDNEIAQGPDADFVNGGLVSVISAKGQTLGIGFFNSQSRIAFRYLTRNSKELIDEQFWRQRVEAAYRYRKARYRADGTLPIAYRLIHGEADGMPGLVADVYGDYVVVQILALGLEQWRQELIRAIAETADARGIYERSDSPVRLLEGMAEKVGLIWGEAPPDELVLEDAGMTILVDLKEGAKTGLFLDQRENQKVVAKEAMGRDVLNCFSYTGLFGIEAALRGAKSIADVEISEKFNRLNDRQWQRNSLNVPHTIETANVFDYLRDLVARSYQSDMVILDPPAFTKNRASLKGATRGYNEINRLALKLLPPGGILVTCSCSHHLSFDQFCNIVQKAAVDAKRQLKLIARRGQGPDHPVLLNAPEGEYLKCLIFAVE